MIANRIIVHAAVVSHKGRIRSNNEDNFYLNGDFMPLEKMDAGADLHASFDSPLQIYSVCDGMGGAEGGEYASCTAVRQLHDHAFDARENLKNELTVACRKINEAVFHSADGRPGEGRNGSTFTCVAICRGQALVAHIGDSRVYRFHHDKLIQVTTDHNEVQRMISMGILTEKQAANHPNRHAVTRYLGIDPTECVVEPSFAGPYPLEDGDRFLLCSDGLTDMLASEKIAELMKKEPDSQGAASALVNAALDAGGVDNVTVMVLTVETLSLFQSLRRKM